MASRKLYVKGFIAKTYNLITKQTTSNVNFKIVHSDSTVSLREKMPDVQKVTRYFPFDFRRYVNGGKDTKKLA